jgi:hypothetical protein
VADNPRDLADKSRRNKETLKSTRPETMLQVNLPPLIRIDGLGFRGARRTVYSANRSGRTRHRTAQGISIDDTIR